MGEPLRAVDCSPDVWTALQGVIDPCLAASGHCMSVLDLGLISGVTEDGETIEVRITFTEVGCQFTHRVISSIEDRLLALDRFRHVRVLPEWRPGWTEERMTDQARAALAQGRLHMVKRIALGESPTAPQI
jgi:metal-sulfur cluster biosynthetic enzyme